MSTHRSGPLRGLLLAAALTVPLPLAAQNVTGTIAGTIVDEQRQVVPGATVTVLNESTGESRVAVSDVRGDFQVTALLPGTYTVRVELTNFRTIERTRNVLSATERLSVGTLVLEVGLGETITVESMGTQVNTADSQHSGLITARQIEQIQVRARDVTQLLRLLPGVRYEDNLEAMGDSFGTLVPHIGGQRRDWNTIMVDGVLGNEIGQANRLSTTLSLDSVAEVKVLLNNYRAEYGRTGGAQVQIVTKSGTSEYMGGAYYYGRHESLNANNFFNNRSSVDKPRYRFNTYGANLGGPVPGTRDSKKLLFFYSLEAPFTERPGPLRNWTLPTDLERRGDFSQTLDSQGRLIHIRDSQRAGACNAVTGGPGCFPGNVIPADRLNQSGQAILNLMPLPTLLDRSFTNGQFNHQTQEIAENPKRAQTLRVDWRPSSNDSFYFTLKDWYSDQRGSEVTAGPNKWGWFNTHYLNTDRAGSANYTKIISSNVVNEAAFGVRRQTEQFHPVTEADWQRIRRSDVGFTLGQFNPGLNPEGILPKAIFNVASPPNLTYDNRCCLSEQGEGWLFSFRNDLTWIRGSHTLKTGAYVERLRNSEGRGGVGAGPWSGQFTFSTDANNPFETNHSFANALLGTFQQYTEIDAYAEVQARRFLAEWYVQDTWKAARRVTVDYGMRFLYYRPWFSNLPTGVFVPERYDPALAPVLFQPLREGNQNFAVNPLTGERFPNVLVGSFVPGTGSLFNGIVTSSDPDYPRGFRANQGIHPEPRVGLAWDIFGDGSTALHSSAGIYHNAHITARSMDRAAAVPPIVNSPTIFYGTMDTLLQTGGFSSRPSNAFGLERDAKTPTSYNWSIGIQRDLGWGTVVDVTYSGYITRNIEVAQNINVVPDGSRFLDLNPQNADPRNPATALPAEFLRPYQGFQDIDIRKHIGTSDYNGLQMQLNRRYIRGLQFAVAYTFSKTRGVTDEDEGSISAVRPYKEWHYAPYASNQTHSLVVNYTWDLPRASTVWNNGLVRAVFDNWQLSGENALVSGDWAPVFLSTTPTFDFTGGDGGAGTNVGTPNGGDLRVVRPNLVGDPTSGNRDARPGEPGSWLNWDAFARPARGEYGNAPRYVFQLPRINNWNLSFFKNVPMGGRRRVQLRWEMYNVLNHTQFSSINNTAQFNTAGEQVNANFGKATAARNPRIMQGSIRFGF